MRYLVTGGSRFDPQIGHDFHALGIDVLQAYGLTETSAAAFATSPHDNVIGSVGKPLDGVEAKIVDPLPQEDGGQAVGEIVIRGAIVMKGYWNRPDATAAALKDGWLYTGDLGYFDAGGNLFITGSQERSHHPQQREKYLPGRGRGSLSEITFRRRNCGYGDGKPPGRGPVAWCGRPEF